jgi:hypothetical protein
MTTTDLTSPPLDPLRNIRADLEYMLDPHKKAREEREAEAARWRFRKDGKWIVPEIFYGPKLIDVEHEKAKAIRQKEFEFWNMSFEEKLKNLKAPWSVEEGIANVRKGIPRTPEEKAIFDRAYGDVENLNIFVGALAGTWHKWAPNPFTKMLVAGTGSIAVAFKVRRFLRLWEDKTQNKENISQKDIMKILPELKKLKTYFDNLNKEIKEEDYEDDEKED